MLSLWYCGTIITDMKHKLGYRETLRVDFNDIGSIINDPMDITRRDYLSYLSGDYHDNPEYMAEKYDFLESGRREEIFRTYKERWDKCKVKKQRKSFVSRSFFEFLAFYYGSSYKHMKNCLVDIVGVKKLEELNLELIKDVIDFYHYQENFR